MDSRRMNVVMVPWLAYGHISPFLELAKNLVDKNFYMYICSTTINLNSIKQKLVNEKHLRSIQLVELQLPSSPDLPPNHHTTNGLPPHLMTTLKSAFDMAAPSFSHIIETLTPDLVIYDHNCPWAPATASDHNIPAVLFLTGGALMISFALNLLKNRNREYPFPEIHLRNIRRLMIRGAPESSQEEREKEVRRILESLKRSSDIILVKSFREIEGKYIDFFSTLAEKKIVPVGPLIEEQVGPLDDRNTEIAQWLDKKDESSSVFVSFGSECFLTKEEILEVAHGLELSKVNFIWVLRFSTGEKVRVDEVLPKGFLENVGEKGMVVEGWAPQAQILAHPSIGGFVSHCGWSSVMESMNFGVPIIALPMHLDQPLNARIVEQVGVGIEVKGGENGELTGDEIGQVIRRVVVEKDGEEVRNKARNLKDMLRSKGDEEIGGVVEELLQLSRKG
ncbi:UDP-glucosyltransferase 29-like [Rhododendron vialii]|uniref:UDP-glucosyltransferase 29-like n=1 Tax=Rhododendron vialii TaxID=182163 RepID=UPI00265E18D1|nr:UDP-glucosyltransferase 29-like [Rhododendron vialii]